MVRDCLTTGKKSRKLLSINDVLFVPKRQIRVRFTVGARISFIHDAFSKYCDCAFEGSLFSFSAKVEIFKVEFF